MTNFLFQGQSAEGDGLFDESEIVLFYVCLSTSFFFKGSIGSLAAITFTTFAIRAFRPTFLHILL